MQLVGATDWFIRWPFVIEGLVVGLFGAGIAVGILFLGKVTIVDPLSDNFALVENLNTIAFGPLIAALVVGAHGGRGAWQRSDAAPFPAHLSQPTTAAFLGGLARRRRRSRVALLRARSTPLRDAAARAGSRAAPTRRARSSRTPTSATTDADELEDALDRRAWSARSRKKNDDKFSHYFDPETYERFHGVDLGRVLRDRPQRHRGRSAACGSPRSSRTRRPRRPGSRSATRSSPSRASRSPASPSTAAASRIKGPPGTEVEITVVDGETGKERDARRRARRGPDPGRRVADGAATDGAKIGYVRLATFTRGAHGELRDAIEQLCSRRAPRASSSTCAATAAACSTRPCSSPRSSRRTGRS